MVNIFTFIILLAIALEFGSGLAADILNLKALILEPPADFKDIYKPEEYRRSQEYIRVSTRFGWINSSFRLAILLVFWFSKGFNYLDLFVRSLGFHPILNGLIYAGILVVAYEIIMLPFSIYATFSIEGRFGFNRTTPRLFLLDQIKGFVLSLLLGAPLLAAILALFQYAGNIAWVYCWITVTAFTLAVEFIAPNWIMPLFNKFTPMPAGELKEAIMTYARSVNYPISNVFVMDGSKRSTRANAFFTGFGRNKRIALFDTLINQHTTSELVAVLAHEIGHYKKKHILQGIIISILHTGVLFFILSLFLQANGLYQAFFVTEPSIYTGLVFFGLLYTPIEFVLSIVMQMVSRKHESEADLFAPQTVERPQSLVDALKKLSANNLSNLSPHPFYVFLNYSHPPLVARARAIEQYEKQKVKQN